MLLDVVKLAVPFARTRPSAHVTHATVEARMQQLEDAWLGLTPYIRVGVGELTVFVAVHGENKKTDKKHALWWGAHLQGSTWEPSHKPEWKQRKNDIRSEPIA